VTESPVGDDAALDGQAAAGGVQRQRQAGLRRPIDATADADGQAERDAHVPYGDNLRGGNVPEEDGVDHRVEPGVWLTDGSDEGAPGGSEQAKTTPGERAPAGGEASPKADLPPPAPAAQASSSNGTFSRDVPYADQDVPYTGQQVAVDNAAGRGVQERPPSSAAAGYSYRSAAEQARGDGLRVPPYQPQVPPSQAPPYPAQVRPAPPPSVASRVTASFASLTKPRPKKPARPSRAPTAAAMPAGAAAVRERVAAATRTGNVPRGTAPTRRAQLVLARIEPWSVMKFSFMISLVGWVILFVAVAALYYVLNKLGVFHAIQSTITSVTSSKGSSGADASGSWFSASRILGYTMLVGAINVVLITALATVGAVIYNLVTHLAGGIEVTLKETD
jgi:hypothetical protein